MRSFRSRRRLAVVVISLGVGLAAVPSSATAACRPKHAHTVAKLGSSAIYSVATGAGDEYGTPTTIYGCLKGQRRASRLERFGSTTQATLTNVRFAGKYVAFAQTLTDVACSKYDPNNPQCTSHQLLSFNIRTAKRRARVDTAATAPVLVNAGWIAWTEPDSTTLRAVDSAGVRTLDEGPVDAASVRASGNVVSWMNGAEARQAQLQ